MVTMPPKDLRGPVPPQDRPQAEPPPSASSVPDSRRQASRAASPPRALAVSAGQGDGVGGPDVPCQREPLPLCEVIGGLLELSDLLDGQLRQRLAAYREGYQHGREEGYDAGYDDGIAERKRAQQDIVEALRVHARRWELRGEPRARETFGRPHPGDYPGRKGAA